MLLPAFCLNLIVQLYFTKETLIDGMMPTKRDRRAPLWYTHDRDTTICTLVYNVNTLSKSLFCSTCKFLEEEETFRLDTGSQMMLDGLLGAMEKGLRLVWFSNTRVTLFKTENGHRETGLVLRCRLNGCLPHTEADPRGEAGARGWGWGGG